MAMTDRLRDRTIVVVGSASGIGAATVARLAAEGATVCAADIDLAGARRVAQASGGRTFAIEMDIAEESSVSAGFAEAAERLGGLDGVHINAADLRTIFADSNALELELAVFDRTLAMNLRGHLLCTRAALPHLLARGGGAIVYTSSGACDAGDAERPAYAMSKSGLNALMRHVARRWGPQGVTANAIAPGFVLTPEMRAGGHLPQAALDHILRQTPATRLGEVEDIAAMAALLLSDEARWINGQVIHINGGALMR